MIENAVKPHNRKSAANWGAAGRNYENFSAHFGDAIRHCIERLAPQPGERLLDVATGTGWGARRAARYGAKVHGIDFARDLIESATLLAKDTGTEIAFSTADAEDLPFEDASFDVVMSTFGVMFVGRQEVAARELARVCKPGGRLGLTTWPPDGTIAGCAHDVLARYRPPPPDPPPPSQFAWGTGERLRELLEPAFALRFETGCSVLRAPAGADVWDLWCASNGVIVSLAKSLPPDRLEQLRDDFIAYHERFRNDLGIAMPRDYLVTIGLRK